MINQKSIFETLLEKKASLISWTAGLFGVIFLRTFIEQFVASSKPLYIFESIIEYVHNFYFFSISIVLIWIFLSLIMKVRPQELSGILIFSLFFTLLPPLIDMVKTGGEIYWSFYLLSSPRDLLWQYLTIFGNLPSGIVYFGTKITFLAVIFLSSSLVWLKTKSYWKSFFSAIAVYSILFFMGSFPSLFFYAHNFIFGVKNFFKIKSFEIAQFFGAPNKILGIDFPNFQYALAYRLDFIYYIFLVFLLAIIFFMISRKKFVAVLKNLRLPQIIYHSGLFFIGIGLGYLNYPQNFKVDIFSILLTAVLLISIWFAWLASLVPNDIYDFEIDNITNTDRPLPQKIFSREEYIQFGIVCFLLSILGAISVGFSFAVLLIVYQIIAWIYSAEPFRLKKIPVIATFISSLASLTILFMGYILMSDGQTIDNLSWRIILLLIVSYTISLPIKDFKDIEGDKKYGVFTIPVIFGEKKARLIVAASVFTSYILSVFWLNELNVFWWAMLLGSFSFLAVSSEKINPRNIFWWVLAPVSIYVMILAKVTLF